MKESRVARHRRSRPYLYAVAAVGAVVLIVALAILVDSVIYYNNIHAGVTIAGQDVSGKSPEEAAAQLNDLVDSVQQNSVTLVLAEDGRTWDVMPAEMGTRMDVGLAVSKAMAASREGNIFTDLGRRVKLYFSHVDVPLTGTIDDQMADEKLAEIAAEIDLEPVNAGLTIENDKITVIDDQYGRAVDQDALREELRGLLTTLHTTEVEIPVAEIRPVITADDTSVAVEQAEVMSGAPITLTNGEQQWVLTPEQIISFMGFSTRIENGVESLVPYLDASKMEDFFASIAEDVATDPVNASFESDGSKAWVVPGVLGQKLDPLKTAQAISQASTNSTGRTAEVGLQTTEPELTTEKAEARGIKDLLATYSDSYGGSSGRQNNVRITTKYATNVMLAPGESYNFDEQIGPRTAERGYQTAPGIVGPGKLEDVFGGGICEVSTAVFNAVFNAGLEVLERRNHSIFIDHYPKGRDATVSAGGPNLRFRNDTSHYIWLRGTSDGVTTIINIYGTDEGRKVTYSVSDFYNYVGRSEVTVKNPNLPVGTRNVLIGGQSGRQLTTTRKVTLPDGTVLHDDKFISTYPMVPRQIEVGTKVVSPPTTKPPSTTTTTQPPSTTTTATTAAG